MKIMITPIVSEKANAISEQTNRYSFKVTPNATKEDIKKLIHELYDVTVVGISTMNYEGKKKMRYTKRGIQRGKVSAFKKAIVTIAEGQTIDFYSNI